MIEFYRGRRTQLCTRFSRFFLSLTVALLGFALPALAQDDPDDAPDLADSADSGQAEPESSETAETAEPPADAETSTEDDANAEMEASSDGVIVSGGDLFESAAAGGDLGLAEGAGDGEAAASAFDLNGYIRSDVFIGKVPGYDRAELQAGYGELSLKLNMNGGELADAFAELRLRYGQQGQTRELITDLREAYVNAYMGDLELRLGHQIIVWGRADAFNPTNNLTPADLRIRSPVDDDRRVGNLAARAFYDLAPLRLEAAWVPLYKPVEIPDNLTLPDSVYWANADYPNSRDPDLADGTFAGRLHLLFDSMEGSVSYLHGYSLMPGLAPGGWVTSTQSTDPPPAVFVRRAAYNQDVVGADFSTAVGEFGVRAEVAYRRPLHYERRIYAPNPDVQYVLGLDKAFGNLSLIAQYAGRYVFEWEELESAGRGVDVLNFVDQDDTIREELGNELRFRNQILFQQLAEIQHLVSLRAEYLALRETLSISAFGLMNVTTSEWLAYPKIQYKFSDAMSGSIGGEIYFGPEDTLFDLVEEELSAGYAELRYTF